ncbi:MAG: precorrin-8X methylmutase [Cocleimonas sp.]
MIKYEKNPKKVQQLSIQSVKDHVEIDHLRPAEQLIAIKMLIAHGDTSILEQIKFSPDVFNDTMEVMEDNFDLLCDNESIRCGIKQKYLKNEPICLINKASVISQAKSKKYTRSMVAVDLWKPYISDSIVVIGAESTALFRLLELLDDNHEDSIKKPALIIATPAGFSGAEQAKTRLWETCEEQGIPCIVLHGTKGGNDLAAAAINTLLKINKEQNSKQ